VILPVVLFIGVATWIRLSASNHHETLCVVGMNRIRAAYLELAPDLARYFVMSAHDDFRGIGITMGVQPGGGRAYWLAQMISGTPTVIEVLNSVLVGAIAAVAAVRLGSPPAVAFLVGAAGFTIAITLHAWYVRRSVARLMAGHHPMFPTPKGG